MNELKSVELKYDGYLVIPKYNLMVDKHTASEGIIDVHGLGVEPNLTGVMHFVANYRLAKDIAAAEVEAQSISNHESLVEIKLIQLECLNYVNQEKDRTKTVDGGCDVTIVMGAFATEGLRNCQNILLAWFYLNPNETQISNDDICALYGRLREITQHNNIEQNRVGGSSGLYKQPTKALFEMLGFKNVSPWLGRSTVVIPNRDM
eukprot:12458266-Ditylum_brightwellii.AAC.1